MFFDEEHFPLQVLRGHSETEGGTTTDTLTTQHPAALLASYAVLYTVLPAYVNVCVRLMSARVGSTRKSALAMVEKDKRGAEWRESFAGIFSLLANSEIHGETLGRRQSGLFDLVKKKG